MKTNTEPYRPAHNGLKSQTVNLRTTEDETAILKRAAEKLGEATGEKANISKTIIAAVKQFEKKPYYFDERKYQLLCEVHQSSLRWLATICDDYKKLNFGIITKEILATVMSRDLSEIQKRFYERIDLNLKRTGIDDQFILNNYRVGTSTPLTSFEDSVRYNLDQVDFGKRHYQLAGGYSPDAGNYTITEEGTLSFTDQDRERLQAGCMVFIDSDAKIKFSELTEAVIAGLAEIQAILDRNGLRYPLFGEIFNIDGVTGKVSIRKEFIKNIVK